MYTPCKCELGGDCDKVSRCALNNAVEEAIEDTRDAIIDEVLNRLREFDLELSKLIEKVWDLK